MKENYFYPGYHRMKIELVDDDDAKHLCITFK